MIPDLRHPANDRVIKAGLFARASEPISVALEAERITSRYTRIPLREAVGKQAYALGRRKRVVKLAVWTDVEAGLEFFFVDRLSARLALGKDVVYRAEPALRLRGTPGVLPPFAEPVPNLCSPPSRRSHGPAPHVPP